MKVLSAVAAAAAALVVAPAASAAANGRIVFESDRDAPSYYYSNLFSAEADGSNPLRLTPTYYNPGGYLIGSNPDVSPDGTRVVFSAKVGEDSYSSVPTFDLFVANTDGSGVTRLTDTPALELDPVWSPDGTRIAYEGRTWYAAEIFVMQADGSGAVRVTNSADRLSGCGYPQQYTPDWLSNSRLVFVSDGPSAGSSCNRDLWSVNADGSGLAPVLVSPVWELDPTVSADGTKIAFTRGFGIWTMRTDGTELRQITFNSSDTKPAWSPDGRKLAFQSGRYVDGQAIGHQVWTMNADGSNPQPVTRTHQNFDPAWAPAVDRTPPAVSCSAPPVAWSADNVVVACSASDAESGLADAGDATFTLATSVPAGTETAAAATGSRSVCDASGNCATAGPFVSLKVDRKAPEVVLAAPTATTYLLNAMVGASYSCVDGGSGVASCSAPVAIGSAVDTASVGRKAFAVAAVDAVGNSAGASAAYVVSYGVQLLYDPAKPTRRITLQLVDAAGAVVSDPSVALTATSLDGVTLGEGNTFSYVRHNDSYLYRIDPRPLTSGMHTLELTAGDDPTTHSAAFAVR